MKLKMKGVFFTFFLFFLAAFGLSASGKGELPPDSAPLNTEWVFCLTMPDVSALPLSRQIAGDTAARTLVHAAESLDFRFRGEEELSYYRDSAWAKSRAAAAKALAEKRGERDLLIYEGEASWKYKKNLKAIDEAVAELDAELTRINALVPLVETKPALRLSEENKNGTFPLPPEQGAEPRFCAEKNADAFISVSLSEYYGRIYLSLKMYTLYSRSYSFEDSALFSFEDIDGALDEISSRLAAALAGSPPARVAVHTSPVDAVVTLGGSHAGQGETVTRSPGEAELTARAEGYVPFAFPLALNAGELAEISLNLTPLARSAFALDVPESPGSRVYLGSLFAGVTPLTLELPETFYSYLSVETPEGETGSVILKDNELVRGRAEFIRAEGGGEALFDTKLPVSAKEKRVDNARRGFYGAYGAFWIILPVSLIAGGIAGNYIDAYNYGSATGAFDYDYNAAQSAYDRASAAHYARIGTTALWAAALGVTFFQIFRYLYVSGADAEPNVKEQP